MEYPEPNKSQNLENYRTCGHSIDRRIPAPPFFPWRPRGMPYIILTANGEELQRAELSGPTIIGRSTECHVSVRDILLSRRHCRVEPGSGKEKGRWRLVDLGSRNGSHVNWKKVTQYTLVDGDVVRIGRTWLTFKAGVYEPSADGSGETASRKNKLVRPADPHEALSGTVMDFVYKEPAACAEDDFDVAPSPKRRPAAPTAAAQDSTLDELSSSWDSIVTATARRPHRMARPIPRAVDTTLGMRRTMATDLSLQVIPKQMAYLQVVGRPSKRRADVLPAVIMSVGIVLATLFVLVSGWVMMKG